MRDPNERLRDILEAIAAIERHLHRGKAAFERDELLQGWFVRNLQIIGEAARALPEGVRALAPEVEWPKIVGMRNVLAHGYFDIDADIVWAAANRDALALKPRIQQLLQRLEGPT
ncbi:MAG TPA: HepT-like ribonuclease domain-containing protein [Chthonomonadales bacterium]|nr:HepT-like ribonuclease domain-containing protein [Chthonomonadales bacterium]